MKKIDTYTRSEFNVIRDELNAQLKGSYDIRQKKEFFADYIPKEIIFRTKALVDTQMNFKMDEAVEYLKKYNISIQNKFFEADFEKRFKTSTDELNPNLISDRDAVPYSRDPRMMNGIIAGGSTFVIGSAVTAAFLKTSKVGAVISGATTILLSILAYRVTYNKFSEQARQSLGNDVHDFLTKSEIQVTEWLNSIDKLFDAEFHQFLDQHNLK